MFVLEALPAKHGDCLLLHLGDDDDPRLVVVDGGPSGVWPTLRARLEELRAERAGDGTLDVDLLMVSHVDADHVDGVLDLTAELVQADEDGLRADFRVRRAWHNSFDDLVHDRPEALTGAALGGLSLADLDAVAPASLPVSPEAALVLASVAQGRQLRRDLERLAITTNAPFDDLVLRDGADGRVDPPWAPGVEVTVVGPAKSELVAFQEAWDEELRKKGLAIEPARLADFSDKSVFNLASIVVLVRSGGRSMLLTGDARGDHVLTGLRELGLLSGAKAAGLPEDGAEAVRAERVLQAPPAGDPAAGHLHVDLLKLPHHGSDRNVSTDFFRAVTADHYVVSGDGGHGNPELATFEMLFAARDDDRPFTIHLTYPPEAFRAYRGKPYPAAKLRELFRREAEAGRDVRVVTGTGDRGVVVDLSAP